MNTGITSVLGFYHFFSKLLPGFAFLSILALFVPVDLFAKTTTPVVPVLLFLLAPVLGQLLHATSVYAERNLWNAGHRRRFADLFESDGRETGDQGTLKIDDRFVEVFDTQLDTRGVQVDEIDGYESLYVLARSAIEIDGRGRSIQFQALYSFSRSALLASGIGVVALLFVVVVRLVGAGAVPPTVPAGTVPLPWLLAVLVALVVLVAVFRYAVRFYRDRLVEYTVLDFLTLVTDGTGSDVPAVGWTDPEQIQATSGESSHDGERTA